MRFFALSFPKKQRRRLRLGGGVFFEFGFTVGFLPTKFAKFVAIFNNSVLFTTFMSVFAVRILTRSANYLIYRGI